MGLLVGLGFTVTAMTDLAIPPLPSRTVYGIENFPSQLLGGVTVTTSPAVLALLCFTLPRVIPNESPSTSNIFEASENVTAPLPAVVEVLAILARGL